MVEIFETTEDEVFKRAYEISESLREYIKENHINNPAISILHALAILYIHFYRQILINGTDVDKKHALKSLGTIFGLAIKYSDESE